MKNIHLTVLMLLTLLFSACKDDTIYGGGDYSNGEPATLNMRITVPVDREVKPLSRSFDKDRESEIKQLVIVGFESSSGRQLFIDLTGNLVSTSISDKAGRTYTLNEEVNVEAGSGRYRLYLIANWQSAYANLTASDIKEMSEDEIKALDFTNTDEHIIIFGDYGLPMSQVLTGEQGYYEITAGSNTLNGVQLERATAHIEFTIQNGTGTGTNVPNFEPTGYTVYRLPKGAKTFADAEAISTTYFNSTTTPVVKQPGDGSTTYTFDFFMLENKQTSTNTSMTNWTEREAWDSSTGSSNNYAERKFTNAPENATFVVLSGNYSGPADKNDDGTYTSTQYFGAVSYIIHLGNFNTSQGGSLANFTVNRNEHHIYNVTVNGASSIMANVNVENTSYNPAVEGYLSTQPIAKIDAHYAKIMLTIPVSSVFGSNDTNGKNQVVLKTVKNNFAEALIEPSALTDADDYKWIQFQAPADENTFPTYAGKYSTEADGYCYIKELVAEIEEYIDNNHDASKLKHATASGSAIYVAAFVDENIYDKATDPAIKSWAGYTVEDRTMTLNPAVRKVSSDEQSTIAAASAFNIIQSPVVSTYSLDPNLAAAAGITVYNPFGLEQVEEPTSILNNTTGQNAAHSQFLTLDISKKFFESALQWDAATTTELTNPNNANGREMTLYWYSQFENGVDDDYTSFYKLTSNADANYSTYVFTPAADFYTVSKALVSRNRDLNGDGKITSDEIRWYIPNIVQYYIYNFGYNIVPEDLRLSQYEEDNIDTSEDGSWASYNGNRDYIFPRYYSSSRNARRLFWQDQRGATSAQADWACQTNNIRFARNLGQFTNSYSADYTRMSQINTTDHTITISNICRNWTVTGAYPYANALSETYNRLPKKMQYIATPLAIWGTNSVTSTNTVDTNSENKEKQDALDYLNQLTLAAYNSANSTSLTELPDGWRIPNQRELIALFITGVLDSYLGDDYCVYSATFYNSNLWYDRTKYPVGISAGNFGVPKNSDGFRFGRPQGVMPIVRDVTTTSTASAKLRAKGVVRKK